MSVITTEIHPEALFRKGRQRVITFCTKNRTPIPKMESVSKDKWIVGACAYYRPKSGIRICLEECARPCSENQVRNWNWMGSTTDREPYGVLCHELGHHCDWLVGDKKWSYGSEYSSYVRFLSGEPAITSYCPNDSEWFAEIMRLFITNHALLELLRPKAYEIISERFEPVSNDDWVKELGSNVPQRILSNLKKKVEHENRRR